MAGLADLKRMLDEARRRAAAAHDSHGAAQSRTAHSPHREPPSDHRGASPAAKRAAATRRAVAATKHAEGDVDLAAAFADVTRLPPSTRAPHSPTRPTPLPHQRIADDRAALAASKYGVEPAPQSWDIGQELEGEQTFVRRGLSSDILTKLRRGHWSVQDELDLHGHTTVEARDTLADFLAEARARGCRCVRVIHGKGNTSPNREPVLKGKVRKWLAHRDEVLAYCEAPQHAGGGGAVLILLRGR